MKRITALFLTGLFLSCSLTGAGEKFSVKQNFNVGNRFTAEAATGNIETAGDITTVGALELGHASDTTIARSGAGAVTVEGVTLASQTYVSGGAYDARIKGWINFTGTGVIAVNDSFNVASIGDNGVGIYQVNWDTDFANTGYVTVANSAGYAATIDAQNTTHSIVRTYDIITGNAVDAGVVFVLAAGDQ